MSQLGLGVMIQALSGRQSVDTSHYLNKPIKLIVKYDDLIKFVFEDNTCVLLSDEGQSCCEHRYVTCDDELESFYGRKIISIEQREVDTVHNEYGECHEKMFVVITMDDNTSIHVTTHNEHNGYYGGFYLVLKAI